MARLAKRHHQTGWIANTTSGISIAIEGLPDKQQQFLDDLHNRLPPFAEIRSQTIKQGALENYQDFWIQASIVDNNPSPFVLPDIATCEDCIQDIFNPNSRFYNYPFTSCSYCGPRYSIMYSQPYDRGRTTMNAFKLCQECGQEYQSIDDRRFHAQTIACPNCGPQLRFQDASGKTLEMGQAALQATIGQLRSGKIVALKSIGGFQLLADASNQATTKELRQRKHRPQKPFALMVADLNTAKKLCIVNEAQGAALLSPAAPIVLLERQEVSSPIRISDAVAPGIGILGIMLPCSPLHHLLLHEFSAPLIATSGNLQDEPICIDNEQAMEQLHGIADFFLTHDRPILRPLDDSIVRIINGKTTVLRRARGFAPFPITVKIKLPETIAMGGQLKSTVAIGRGKQIILSQHLGDLGSEASQQHYRSTLDDLQNFYQIIPKRIMHDLHKGYTSSGFSGNLAENKHPVQHHYAHALSCMAEHGLEPPLLAIVWDGSGMGDDNTLWGGEFLLVNENGYQRFAHFRPFPLPGGVKAIREPRRSALGLLFEIIADKAFDQPKLSFSLEELKLIKPALEKQINCPRTTSAGRLFDAAASLLGLCQINAYEGQAAMFLENRATKIKTSHAYPFGLRHVESVEIDWQPTFEKLLEDTHLIAAPLIAAKFHNTLADIILAIAKLAGQNTIVLSGGCFQNVVLVEKAVEKLNSAGFIVYCHEKIPPNDGGLALGQLYAVNYLKK